MNVFIVYEKEGWEIVGIEAVFDSREKASVYLEKYKAHVIFQNWESWVEEQIVEVTVR